jgi:hypothetical protein
MSKAAPAADTGPIADVAHPGTSAPADTSKPIITSRKILKDPMMVTDIPVSADTAATPAAPPADQPTAAKVRLKPVDEPSLDPVVKASPESAAPEPPAEAAKPEPAPDNDLAADQSDSLEAKAASERAEYEAKLQKAYDSKQYFLPINSLEQRRTARFVTLGVALSLLLAIIWVDIALDASLIKLGDVKPVTHFFSN